MNDEATKVASDESGSATGAPAAGEAGQAQQTSTGTPSDTGATGNDASQNYAELEKRFGEQGRELGEYREFIEKIRPILTPLDENPEFARAIAEGKVDSKLMTAILAGKVKIEEAQQVAEAHEQVKQDMGAQAYAQATPQEIERRVTENLSKSLGEQIERKFKDADEMKEFDDNVNTFIAKTTDFEDYADGITAWLTEHPEQTDIEVAYWTVKGQALAKAAQEAATKDQGEQAKEIAANAAGGNAPAAGTVPSQNDPWDDLVSSRISPNTL